MKKLFFAGVFLATGCARPMPPFIVGDSGRMSVKVYRENPPESEWKNLVRLDNDWRSN